MLSRQESINAVLKCLHNWIQRVPSYAFDNIGVWDDILTARGLYLDLYNFRLKNDFRDALKQNRDLNDIEAIL